MKLIIAEKPELGKSIARAVAGAPAGVRLPYEGRGYRVVSCIGHLLEYEEPSDIDRDRYGDRNDLSVLPILLRPWPLKVPPQKADALKEIGRGLAECDGVIHAGDPDDEGQLLVDEVLDHFGYEGPVQRVYINDNLEKNIRRAFERLRDNDECRGDGRAAQARRIADFCFGINESRLMSAKTGGAAISLGRVQTPTLGLVVRRDEEIMGHTAVMYHIARATLSIDGRDVEFTFKPDKDILDPDSGKLVDRAAAQEALDELAEIASGTLECKVERKRYPAPLPYNLTDLTADMSKRHKMSAKAVLDATQTLRERHRAITYNRSDCNYLPTEAWGEAPAVLGAAMRNIGADWDLDFSIKGRCFDDASITAHTGIIPQETEVDAAALGKYERSVYTAIAERYAMQFAGDAEGRVSTAEIRVAHGVFSHRAGVIDEQGWRSIRADGDVEKGLQDGWLEEGTCAWSFKGSSIEEKKTKPRPRYTEGTLMKDMASIAKYVSDPETRRILKEKDAGKKGEHGGIGTSATRAKTIETLKLRGYVESANGKLVSTNLGRAVYHACPDDINGADLTAKWYLMCEEVRAGRADVYSVSESVVETFNSHRDTAYEGVSFARGEEVAKCPLCGKRVMDRGPKARTVSCESVRGHMEGDKYVEDDPGCGFFLWKTSAGKKLTTAQLKKLITDGSTDWISGFKSKKGSTFSAKLHLEGPGEIRFEYKPRKGGPQR